MTSGIKGLKNVEKKLKNISSQYEKSLKAIINTNSILLASHTRENYLQGGTTDTKLRTRSGKLKASTKPLMAVTTKDGIKGGISFGTIYAGIHIGKRGHVTTIVPKRKQYLAIPLKAAKTDAGVGIGGPRQEDLFGKTFVRKSKAGNLIIWGQLKKQKGADIGGGKGGIVPLFVLKKQVRVKTRVDVNELIGWIKPKIINDLKKVKIK